MATPIDPWKGAPPAYSLTELTRRVKELECIILDMMGQQISRGYHGPFVRTICVNASLHSYRQEEMDAREHPPNLLVPHYAWQPQIDWGRDLIGLHPENRPR